MWCSGKNNRPKVGARILDLTVIPYLCDHEEVISLLSLFVSQIRQVISKVLLALSFCKYSCGLWSSSYLEKMWCSQHYDFVLVECYFFSNAKILHMLVTWDTQQLILVTEWDAREILCFHSCHSCLRTRCAHPLGTLHLVLFIECP